MVPSAAPANACASGGHAVVLGAMFLRSGEADLALCGAGESAFTPADRQRFRDDEGPVWAGSRAIARSDDPAQASRPFSVDRAGFVLAEGAGALVLATEIGRAPTGAERPGRAGRLGDELRRPPHGHALRRPDRPLPGDGAAARAAEARDDRLLQRPRHQHGPERPGRDPGIKDVFGDAAPRLPISSIKGALGHSLGAASAIEAAVAVRALREQVIPPTINYVPDPELDLDYVPNQARQRPARSSS